MKRELPVLKLTPEQFRDLPEYSCSMPTGTTSGKQWKRLDGSHDRAFIRRGGKPRWMIGEYGEIIDEKTIKLNWYKPVISITAATA